MGVIPLAGGCPVSGTRGTASVERSADLCPPLRPFHPRRVARRSASIHSMLPRAFGDARNGFRTDDTRS